MLKYKKAAFWVIIIAVIACIVVALCFLTDPKDKTPSSETLFAEIPTSYHMSGNGAWSMELNLKSDGSFTGVYSDWDAADDSYVSKFSGTFSEPVQVDDYTYSVRVKSLQYGSYAALDDLETGTEMLICLPGHPIDDTLAEDVRFYMYDSGASEGDSLPFYAIGTANGNLGMISDLQTAGDIELPAEPSSGEITTSR